MAKYDVAVYVTVDAKNADSATKKVQRLVAGSNDNWFVRDSKGTVTIGHPVKQ